MGRFKVLALVFALLPAARSRSPLEPIAQEEHVRDARNTMWVTPVRLFLRQFDWSLVAMILAIKGLIYVFGAQSYQLLANKRIEGWRGWLEIWNRWDSLRHMRLAEFGYTNVGVARADIVGFPLYPWVVRLGALLLQDYLVSGFVVSGVASVAAGLLLHRLVLIDYSDSLARSSMWFMLIFPTSYFLHINYTESLFVL